MTHHNFLKLGKGWRVGRRPWGAPSHPDSSQELPNTCSSRCFHIHPQRASLSGPSTLPKESPEGTRCGRSQETGIPSLLPPLHLVRLQPMSSCCLPQAPISRNNNNWGSDEIPCSLETWRGTHKTPKESQMPVRRGFWSHYFAKFPTVLLY